jgi:hypothetical protein
MFFKNNKLVLGIFILIFIFFGSFGFTNAQSTDSVNQGQGKIDIKNLQTEFEEYSAGQKLNGSFNISNGRNVNVINLYYQIRLYSVGLDNRQVYYAKDIGPINVNSLSDETIDFELDIPMSVQSDYVDIEVSLTEKTGWYIDFVHKLLKIDEKGHGDYVVLNNAQFVAGDKIYGLQEGPFVDNKDIYIKLDIGNLNDLSKLNYEISYFDFTNIYKTIGDISGSDVVLNEDGSISIPVKKMDENGVFVGSLKLFNDDDQILTPIEFRYIKGKNIVTINSLTSNESYGHRGDEIKVSFEYMGQPFDIDTGEVSENGEGSFVIKLYNQKDELVGEIFDELNLNINATVESGIFLTEDSRLLKADIVITNSNGDVVEKYQTNLSGSELSYFEFYKTEITVGIIVLIILISFLIFGTEKIMAKKEVVGVMLLLLILIGTSNYANALPGYTSIKNFYHIHLDGNECESSSISGEYITFNNCMGVPSDMGILDCSVIEVQNKEGALIKLKRADCIRFDGGSDYSFIGKPLQLVNWIVFGSGNNEFELYKDKQIITNLDSNNYVNTSYSNVSLWNGQIIIRGPEGDVPNGELINVSTKMQINNCANSVRTAYVEYTLDMGDEKVFCSKSSNFAGSEWASQYINSESACASSVDTFDSDGSNVYDSTTKYFKAPNKNGNYQIGMFFKLIYKGFEFNKTNGYIPFTVSDVPGKIEDIGVSACGTDNGQIVTQTPSELCDINSYLISDSFSENISDWNWSCMNTLETQSVSCSASCPVGYEICNGQCIPETQECTDTPIINDTSLKISCNGPAIAEIPVGESSVDVTWNVNVLNSGTTPYTYEWTEDSSEEGSSLTKNCTSVGPCSIGDVTVTDDNSESDSATCNVTTVTDSNTTGVVVPTITSWSLSPSIVDSGEKCGVNWNISNASYGCTLESTRNPNLGLSGTISGVGNVTSDDPVNNIQPGFTYVISCDYDDGLGGILTETSEPKTCHLNPSFSE